MKCNLDTVGTDVFKAFLEQNFRYIYIHISAVRPAGCMFARTLNSHSFLKGEECNDGGP